MVKGLPVVDRGIPRMTARSGTQRVRRTGVAVSAVRVYSPAFGPVPWELILPTASVPVMPSSFAQDSMNSRRLSVWSPKPPVWDSEPAPGRPGVPADRGS
jgi:hypothetical protein